MSIGVTLLTVGTVKNIQSSNAAKRATQEAATQSRNQFAAESKRADIQNVRSVRQQIRAARMAQASMLNTGAQSGGTGGSAMAGGLSSLQSQLGGNLDYMSQIAQANTEIGGYALASGQAMSQASVHGTDASMWGSVANTGMTIFGQAGGFKELSKKLSTANTPPLP